MGQLIENKEIFAIGGGKGGVGKSFLASNLGIILAKSNRDTVLIDADLGGANLHTCLGIPAPEVTFSDFVNNPVMRMEDVILRTSLDKLSLISGAQDFLGIANPKYSQKVKIMRAIQSLKADYIILDLGAGTSFNTLDFFLLADKGVIVVLPEPTSIENAYRFIKSAFYRKLKLATERPDIRDIIDQAMDRKNKLGLRAPVELLDYIKRMDPAAGIEMEDVMDTFRPRLVLNQVRSAADIRIGFSIQSACLKYFGVRVDYVGYVENDDQIWQSIRKRQPVALSGDYLKSVRHLRTLSHNLLGNHQIKPE